jgi:hypothetical protein
MADVERADAFERRLATALERLADDAPTTVDAAAIAHAIAVRESAPGRTAWPRWAPTVGIGARFTRLVRIGVVVAALLALLAGLAILAQRLAPASIDGPFTGRLTCGETSWSDRPAVLTLDCTFAVTGDRGLGGHLGGMLSAVPGATEPRSWAGQVRLETAEGTWTGALLVGAGPNGVGSGDVELTRFADTSVRLDLHLITRDGSRWGVLGTRTARS